MKPCFLQISIRIEPCSPCGVQNKSGCTTLQHIIFFVEHHVFSKSSISAGAKKAISDVHNIVDFIEELTSLQQTNRNKVVVYLRGQQTKLKSTSYIFCKI